MVDFYDDYFDDFYDDFYQYEIIVSSGQYFGHVLVYSQTVVCNRSTVRAM